MSTKKEYELYNPKRFKIQLEERDFSRQRKIDLLLPLDIFYRMIDVLSEELRQYFIALHTHKNETTERMKDGGIITKHGILKHKIFKRLFILDRILKTPHFQEIYGQNWKSFKNRLYNPFVKPNSIRDFQQRYYMIFELLSFLMLNKGVLPYPYEVQRFCNKYRALHTKTHLEKEKRFWKELIKIHKKKRQTK
jgi:hypothetical protein